MNPLPLSVERRMQLGFSLVLLLALSIAGTAYQVSTQQKEQYRQVERIHQAQTQIQHVLALVAQVQSGERGTLITGDPQLFDSQADNFADLEPEIATLQELTAESPLQQANVTQLHAHIKEGMQIVERVINLNEQGQGEAARKLVTSGQARNVWTRIDKTIATIEQEEDRLLKQQTEQVEAFQRMANRLSVGLYCLILLSLLSVYFGVRATHKSLNTTLESISDAFFSMDPRFRLTYINGQAQILMQKKRTQLLGKSLWDLFPGVKETDFGKYYQQAMEERTAQHFEAFYEPYQLWFEVAVYPSQNGLSVYLQNITERKATEERLRLLSMVVSESLSSIVITDSHEKIVYVNPAFERISGYTLAEARGHRPGELLQGEDTDPATRQKIRQELKARRPVSVDILNYNKDGDIYWLELHIAPVFNSDGELTNFVAIENDITVRKKAEQDLLATRQWLAETLEQLEVQMVMEAAQSAQVESQMLQVNEQALQLEAQKFELEAANNLLEQANQRLLALATTDGLTGLNNHRAFRETLNAEFERTQRYKTPLSLILLDVDKFKIYNDTFGHPEGDEVLKTVAEILRKTARDSDYVCRYGGEEFVVLLPHTDSKGSAEAAERFRTAIETYPWALRPVTASFGVSTLGADLTSAQMLIDQADRALYSSKANGRNRVTHVAAIPVVDENDPLFGNASLPYSAIIQEMLQVQHDTLASASEQIREMLTIAYDTTICSWSNLLDMKDKETEGHSKRVTEKMEQMATAIGMNAEEKLYARWGALLHDIGKMGVPDDILHKPGPLTDEEWVIMKQHTMTAYQMLSPISFLRPAMDIPYCHHEKWDGTGYPRGLKGEEIPLAARLFAVIDVYDALTSDRPYRKAWTKAKTIEHLKALSGTHFDPRAVKMFLSLLTNQTETKQKRTPLRKKSA